MLAPKKGLLCNLNHIHLQHISLGLHLSRHPELRDSAGSQNCCEQVDANSNNPSLKCHCCESHAEAGLRNRAAPEDFHCPRGEEEAASPCDPPSTSSSLSSCSDFSLDESPVSVYYRGFPAEPPRCPAEPPGAVPAEDGPHPNPAALRGAEDPPGESPDSLCSSGSHYDETSPVRRSAESRIDLDPNCNPLPDPGPAPPAVPRRWERSSVPPPVPPRPKRRLQLLHGHGAARPAPPEPGAELCGDAAKRNVTSFHELAQKRKRSGAAPVPSRVDRSDWLIVFSPDTELPPHAELLPGAASPDGAGRAPSCGQREITTFKELRYRSNKPKGQTAAPQRPPAPPGGSDGSGWASSAGSGGGRLPAAPEDHREQRGPRAALQPIAEGRPRDAELPLQSRPGERCGGDTSTGRSGGSGGDPRGSGEAENGEETHQEARPSPTAVTSSGAPGAAQPRGDGPGGPSGAAAEQKKALLIAVSTAVDKVIAHFSSARNVVQKAQLGDSWLSPDVGYLLLHTLCPALCGLVEDGLKPFQKDVITGQRRNSPWSVVEASVKTGPNSRSLHALCWRVAGLAPLSSSRQKFHAFILGLLNTKQLEQWVSHLQNSTGVVSALYFPTAFFALSQGPLPHLADELLLLLQPLSVLTFHLDLLFEHHHLSVDVRPLSRRPESPPSPTRRFAQGAARPLEGQSSAPGGGLEDELPPDTVGRAPAAEESPRSQCHAAAHGPPPGPQVGAALQHTLQHVLRWGDQLSRALLGADGSLGNVGAEAASWDAGAGPHGWWAQLSQASRIYAAPSTERFPFVWWTKLRTAAGDPSPGQAAPPQTPPREPKGTELQLLQTKAIPELSSPDSSGSADTSGTSSPEDLVLTAGEPPRAAAEDPRAASPAHGAGRSQAALPHAASCRPGPGRGSWMGRLFGASSARSSPPSPDCIPVRSRRPSSWLSPSSLSPSSRVLAVVVKGLAAEKHHAPEQPEQKVPESPQPRRAVRALCDHTGAADGHLSFHKGDVLQLLSTVDEDWIRCCRGNSTGLVPVGYTSLIL